MNIIDNVGVQSIINLLDGKNPETGEFFSSVSNNNNYAILIPYNHPKYQKLVDREIINDSEFLNSFENIQNLYVLRFTPDFCVFEFRPPSKNSILMNHPLFKTFKIDKYIKFMSSKNLILFVWNERMGVYIKEYKNLNYTKNIKECLFLLDKNLPSKNTPDITIILEGDIINLLLRIVNATFKENIPRDKFIKILSCYFNSESVELENSIIMFCKQIIKYSNSMNGQ
jgi:hypothetical protein